MKQSTLDLARRLVGLKHIEARFDAVEGRLGSNTLEELGHIVLAASAVN